MHLESLYLAHVAKRQQRRMYLKTPYNLSTTVPEARVMSCQSAGNGRWCLRATCAVFMNLSQLKNTILRDSDPGSFVLSRISVDLVLCGL